MPHSIDTVAAAEELARGHELSRVANILGEAGVPFLFMKGTALAYSIYPHPAMRPRCDTDLIVDSRHTGAARAALTAFGYAPPGPSAGEELFGQEILVKRDRSGVEHVLDLHWEISARKAFAPLLPFAELYAASVPLPALGPHARGLGTVDALLLACIHPVMHHHDVERPIWIRDVDLLSRSLDAVGWESFARAARAKRIVAICRRQLDAATRLFRTPIPETFPEAPGGEELASFLDPGHDFIDDLLSDVRALGFRRGLAHIAAVLFPSAAYLRAKYSTGPPWLKRLPLPGLYVWRAARGWYNQFR